MIFSRIASFAALVASTVATAVSFAQVPVYTHTPYPTGGQYKSAWYAPDGLDSDESVWDAFTLTSSTAITELTWRGAYTNYLSGAGLSPVYNFTISIWGSIAGGSQPNIGAGHIVRYYTGNNAGETPAGQAGGVNMYDYHFTLPAAFQATAGVKYWVQIIAWQGLAPPYYWPPDWSLARGVGPDNSHFRRVGGTGGSYTFITGDCVFTLFTSSAPTYTITADVSPAGAGTVLGAGVYPGGSTASLTANPNTGWGFQRWTENGSQVSTNRTYSFTVNANRALVANFVPAYTITTGAWPTYGGTVTPGGTYNEGQTVTVSATANQGFEFAGWTDWGTPVSDSPTYTFTAQQDRWLQAQFVHTPGSTTFDFDNAPVHTSLPVTLWSDGLGATFSGTGSGFSIQPANTMGFTPAGFAGLCIYPNSVFQADLVVDFVSPITYFSMLYSPQELGCDNSARMRVTAYQGATQVGTATTTASPPGTWPTGRLSITVPAGFTRAVVHYDAPPPTCQDYGRIFLADNVTVTRLVLPCDGDVNCDGAVNGLDVEIMELAVGGDTTDFCQSDTDFNQDGASNGLDVEAVELAVGGAPCP